jgi:alkyl sulfatase BDS1-like metallo-beta-lactamase superfamily hydrolase
MTDLLAASAEMIDAREITGPTNPVTNEVHALGDDVAMITSFSHVVVFRTPDGLVLFDTSGPFTGTAVVEALRTWSDEPVHTVVYTHGHVDHVGGSGPLLADGRARGHRDPRVVGHEAVPVRMARYELTNGWNLAINNRQFGGINPAPGLGLARGTRYLPADVARCTDTYADRTSFDVGGLRVELRHSRGETDDHTWAWLPDRRAICTGDFITWVFPNAGNPQKVQRYPGEWARALRDMAALEPELLLPAHGLPVAGVERIGGLLDTIATALEQLVADVLALMEAGATLDEIVHTVRVDETVLALPYLRPVYDEPEFVVRNVWRQYGGWWDGNPARLKPAPDAVLAAELADLAGGVARLVARAQAIGDDDLRLACHLVELAVQAAPEDRDAHAARAELYGRRRKAESSLMTKGIFAAAARDSADKAGQTNNAGPTGQA